MPDAADRVDHQFQITTWRAPAFLRRYGWSVEDRSPGASRPLTVVSGRAATRRGAQRAGRRVVSHICHHLRRYDSACLRAALH